MATIIARQWHAIPLLFLVVREGFFVTFPGSRLISFSDYSSRSSKQLIYIALGLILDQLSHNIGVALFDD